MQCKILVVWQIKLDLFIISFSANGPSWLASELCARGLDWGMVCDLEDKLKHEHLATQAALADISLDDFTHAYLLRLGVVSFSVRRVLINLRLQCTWLGRRLSAKGFDALCLEECERLLICKLKCCTEELFLKMLRPELLRSLPPHKCLSPVLLGALEEIQVELAGEIGVRCSQETVNKSDENATDNIVK